MKVRLPKGDGIGSNLSGIKDMAMKARKMQEEMEKASSEIDTKEYNFTSGGGAVKVSIKGSLEITNIIIDPDIIDKDDKDMLQETVIAAVNGAISMAKTDKDSVMEKISGNIGLPTDIPGLF